MPLDTTAEVFALRSPSGDGLLNTVYGQKARIRSANCTQDNFALDEFLSVIEMENKACDGS
jgi:hypothetical protein